MGRRLAITKHCKDCGLEKDRAEFASSGWQQNSDGTKTRLIKPQCKVCWSKKATSQRQAYLQRANVEMKCIRCGYDDCQEALDLHHRDPREKEFTFGTSWSVSYDRFLEEVQKCVVLCCRCHRELHAGRWLLEN